jgi:PAS domain S-box-containing protein
VFTIKSLRAKTVLSALIPTALVLAAMAIIALYAYERAARDIVQQRDTELARISAARLSEGLSRHSRVLQIIAAGDDVQSMEPGRLDSALEKAQNQLYVFDAGVVVFNGKGVVLWSSPFAGERRRVEFPVPSELDKVRNTLRPVFSNIFRDEISGEDVILVGVPIVGDGNEFRGVLAGIATLKYSALGETYSEVLELTAGNEPFAYLVDGNGRVIHHRYSSQLGRDMAATVPVMRATRGETGAALTEDLTGERVVSGFAPVPGTGWAVITQQRWESVVGPIRGYSRMLLGLIVVGGVISGALIFLAIGRILKPIKDLTLGAQRIAGGDFEHTIAARTGDEIQALAQQFNTMAGALKESYTDLEQKVAARTEALRQAEEKYRSIFENAIEGMYQSTPEGRIITANPAMAHMFGYESPEELLATLTDLKHQLFVEPGRREEALRLLDENGAISGFQFQVYCKDGGVIWVSEVARAVRDESGAVLYYEGAIEDITQRKQAEEALFRQTKEMAVLEERSRMAGEIQDTLAQGFTGIVLQLEAAEQALDESPSEAPDHLSRAKGLARESLQEARRSVWGLLPHALEERPLDAALREEIRRFSAVGRERASFSLSGNRRELPSNVQAALLRICQESLTNVRRHAMATEVEVALTFYTEAVCLGVRDNGGGFDPEAVKGRGRQGGFGLTGMEERARLQRGTLEVRSHKGKGTLVEVKIPTAW